jgi:hypothetical protein
MKRIRPGMMVHIFNSSYSGDRIRRMANWRPVQAKVARTLLKNN